MPILLLPFIVHHVRMARSKRAPLMQLLILVLLGLLMAGAANAADERVLINKQSPFREVGQDVLVAPLVGDAQARSLLSNPSSSSLLLGRMMMTNLPRL